MNLRLFLNAMWFFIGGMGDVQGHSNSVIEMNKSFKSRGFLKMLDHNLHGIFFWTQYLIVYF